MRTFLTATRRFILGFLQTAMMVGVLASDKSGVGPNTISKPSGPGSIEGLGEAFQPTLNTGTAKYALGFKAPTGPGGQNPGLGLSYEAGSGNGPVGFGWSLNLPYVQRQTDKGIPRYGRAPSEVSGRPDRFINDAKEELVPVESGFFFCKNESPFLRYERVGDHWQARRPDGTLLIFGENPQARIFNTEKPSEVFSWLLEREVDTHGNVVNYRYSTFPGAENLNQKYLAEVAYGPGGEPRNAFHFVRFEYESRFDWFEDGRPGFLLRTGMRLKQVIVATQGLILPEPHLKGDWNLDGIPDFLARRYLLEYLPYEGAASHWSLLAKVRQFGANNVSDLPPLSMDYAVCHPPSIINASGAILISSNAPPTVMDAENAEFVDLNGDGLPDILRTPGNGTLGVAHEAWINQGVRNGTIGWSRFEMSGEPQALALGLQTNLVHLADMDGDGLADLVLKRADGSVAFFRNSSHIGWDGLRLMDGGDFPPPAPFGEPNVRVADIDFDKRSDIVRSAGDGQVLQVWLNLGSQGYSPMLQAEGSDVSGYVFDEPGTELADLNGDRVPDLARLHAGGVDFAMGLGYGRFLESVLIQVPDLPDETFLKGSRFMDINGDGLADLVIERPVPGELWFWLNLGNRTFTSRHTVTGLPNDLASGAVLRWADINGNGSSDLVYADSSHDSRIQAVDIGELLGCVTGNHQINRISNGIGRVIAIHYTSSTEYMLADSERGTPWPDSTPFPVQVVSSVETDDSLGHRYLTRLHYHDGYYDPVEKQFRGFARVEQDEVGDPSAPTLVTRSFFDTGRFSEAMKGRLLRLETENETGGIFTEEMTEWQLPPRLLYKGTDGREVRFAHPTSSSKLIRELGRGTERRLESEFEYDDYGNKTAIRDYGIVENGDRSAFDDERFTTNQFALNLNLWLIREPVSTELSDEKGVVLSRAQFFYDDPTLSTNHFGEVFRGDLSLKLEWIDPAVREKFVRTARTKYDVYGNPVVLIDPLGIARDGEVDFDKGHAREIEYDTDFHTYPLTETIHLGKGKDPLVFRAAYDPGFGTVTESTDFNRNRTNYRYDEFGRLINIIRPGDSVDLPTTEYSYALAVPYLGTNLVNYIESRQLDKTNLVAAAKRDSYLISRQFVDGLGRNLLSKTEAELAETGGPPRVSVSGAVMFNARMKASAGLNPFFSLIEGTLDNQLAFESVEAPEWSGLFSLNGSLVPLKLSAAHKSSTVYDATLREVSATNPDGTFRQTVYEPLLTRSFDENDSDPLSPYHDTPMVHRNDGLGRLVEVQEVVRLTDDGKPLGDSGTPPVAWTTRYEYDLNDQLTKITDSQNNVKLMSYDGLQRKTFMNDLDRGLMHFDFDDASNLTQSTDAKGQGITYTYDGANRILTEDYHDEGQPFSFNFAFNPLLPVSTTNRPDVAYFYDAPVTNLDLGDGSFGTALNLQGKLAYVWDLSGEEHTSYDARDRVDYVVKRVRDPLHGQLVGYRTGFAYDSVDRIVSLTYPDNDAIGYQYNDRNLLSRITGGPTGSIISNLVYLPSGQQAGILYGNGIKTDYAYDSRLRLNSLVTAPQAGTASPLIAFGYDFDGVSNIRSITDNRPGSVVPSGDKRRNTQLFQYDDLYRLTHVQYSFTLPGTAPAKNGEITYRYDRIGNMLAQNSPIVQTERELSVTDLGAMSYGGTSGRFNRTGRATSDPAGPHALTLAATASANRAYAYDSNGNMTYVDGMAATWDFKDRLVALEDETMRAEYAYDFTDRRITKRVFKKTALPGGLAPRVAYPYTTVYVGKHFEVREFDAPTKFVFNGNTRIARVTGTLSANRRVERFRVNTGWNLISVAVTALNGGAQLAATEKTEAIYKWDTATRTFAFLSQTDTLPAGSIMWVKALAGATLRVTGAYPGPMPNLRAPPEGDFLPGYGLEAWPLSTFNSLPSTTLWRFAPDLQNWQTKISSPNLNFSDLPSVLAPHEAMYAQASVDLEVPNPALSLRFYHQDHLGSSSIVSDAAGALVEESANYPFGHTRGEARTRSGGEDYQFTQKERDAESGLHCFEARFLTASLGRFTRVDPLACAVSRSWISQPQRWNTYSYAGNNPLRLSDPSGLDWIDSINSAIRSILPQQYATRFRGVDNPDWDHGESQALADASRLADITPGVMTAKGLYELKTGHDPLTGGDVSKTEASLKVGLSILGPAAKGARSILGPLATEAGAMLKGSSAIALSTARGGIGPVLKGQAGVTRAIAAIEAEGGTIVGGEITLQAGAVRTRPDLLIRNALGQLEFVEVKNGAKAVLTANQEAGFPIIRAGGAVPKGANAAAAGLEVGAPLPPTSVRIIRYTD